MANTSNATTTGFARYVVTVISALARNADSLVSIVDDVPALDDALLVLVLDEELLEEPLVLGGGGGGVLLVELVPWLGGEVLFVAFTLGEPSTTSSIGVDKPKTVTLPT
jgi:hypothetical protein